MNDEQTNAMKPKTRRSHDGHRDYLSTEEAAPRLGMTTQGLRARCRRGAVREGREVRCYLGDGVVATKFGRTWRVRFPSRV